MESIYLMIKGSMKPNQGLKEKEKELCKVVSKWKRTDMRDTIVFVNSEVPN